MPKNVDHDAYRLELAQKAALLFSKQGYAGLGMRSIAKELGISKSALYHYFPTKKQLFLACTEIVTEFDEIKTTLTSNIPKNSTIEERVHALFDIMQKVEPNFPNELSLLVDYLRNRSSTEIASDKSRQLARNNYLNLISGLIGKNDSTPVLCLLFGTLLIRFLDGSTTDYKEVEEWLKKALQNTQENTDT